MPQCDAGTRTEAALSDPSAIRGSQAISQVAHQVVLLRLWRLAFAMVHGPEVTDDGAAPVREFLHVGLAQEYGACLFQPAHDLCVFCWNAILEHAASRRGLHACRVEQIFQRDRNTMPLAPHYFGFGIVCLLQGGVRRDRDETI